MFKVRNSRQKSKQWIFRIFLMFFATCIIVQLVNVHVNISRKQREINALREKLDIQIQQNQLLQRQLDFGVTDEYIAKVAREKLNLVLPSERIFIDVTKE